MCRSAVGLPSFVAVVWLDADADPAVAEEHLAVGVGKPSHLCTMFDVFAAAQWSARASASSCLRCWARPGSTPSRRPATSRARSNCGAPCRASGRARRGPSPESSRTEEEAVAPPARGRAGFSTRACEVPVSAQAAVCVTGNSRQQARTRVRRTRAWSRLVSNLGGKVATRSIRSGWLKPCQCPVSSTQTTRHRAALAATAP